MRWPDLRLFGHGDQIVTGHLPDQLPGGQARVLFTYLAVSRSLPARREELIEALWPWRAPAGADASLSGLLSRLRAVLGSEVLSGRGDVRLRLPQDAWIDLEAAEEATHRAESAVAQRDWARGWGPPLVAPFTARRGFLPGQDLPWAQEHRRRLDEIRCSALESYAAVALGVARGNAAEALRVYEALRERLRDELGATPAPELRALQARLLRR
jgi:DNA-binding SARP family transcriptional activator